MTTLNTIIEEEKGELDEIKRLIVEKDPDDDDKFLRQIWELVSQIEESRTTAMQRAYEARGAEIAKMVEAEKENWGWDETTRGVLDTILSKLTANKTTEV